MVKINCLSRRCWWLRSLVIIVTCLYVLAGCAQIQSRIPPSPTLEKTSQTSISVIPQQENASPTVEIRSRPSPTIPPTATALPFPECVMPKAHTPLAEVEFSDYPQTILEYLNQGASLADLLADMQELGINNPPIPFQQVDLNLDGAGDLVVSIIDPGSESISPSGTLLVYLCRSQHYVRAFEESPQEGSGAPAILHVRDLNADGFPEVVTSSKSCGAHTCFESLQLLSWSGDGIQNLLADSTNEIPFPNVQVTDYDQDHVYTLEVVGKGFGSVGAGPQRDVRYIWEYSAEAGMWQLREKSLGSSNYRIHAIHDADEAFNRGEYQVALLLYSQAFNDPQLLDWVDPIIEQLNIGGYARYKSVVTYVAMGDLATASEFYDQMAAFIQPGLPQRVYVLMARLFLDGVESANMASGCSAAREYASTNKAAVLDPLGPNVYGYANREFTPEDMCPPQLKP